ncbi:hypothetical protein [Streptomyces roseolilacinus]|uniref:hypothetical protein n=1 Tax=Streptomyces roseolilacinus TaxID=66904 RepID=UPI0037FEA41A
MPNASVHAELDFALPSDASGYRRLVEGWFVDAVRDLAGPALNPFEGNLDLGGRGGVLKRSGVPYGHPGELWGTLWVADLARGRRKRSGEVWTPAAWDGFLARLDTVPFEVTLMLAVLDADGFPAEPWCTVRAERDVEAPEWVRLMVDRSSEEFFSPEAGHATQRRWTDFLHRRLAAADRTCLHGFIADDVETTTHRTALEAALGLFQDETLPVLDHTLRGYSWLTVLSPGVAGRLGGTAALRTTGAFSSVTALDDGGLVLQATEDMRSYTPDRIAEVFRQVRAVLPQGRPTDFISATKARLHYQEA